MKTEAMEHQAVGRLLLRQNRDCYLLACEQGTGKTWMGMADAEDQFLDGEIEALLVIAPKGVHTNWVLREIPTHMSIPVRAAYFSSGASRKRKNEVEKLFRPPNGELIVLTINIDAINHAEGFKLAGRFLHQYKCILFVDESSRIKSHDAKRTHKVIKLGRFAHSRRCASGTPITNRPQDIFTQFEFLSPDKALLGTTSYRAFVAEYTELLPAGHHVMRHIKQRAEAVAKAKGYAPRPEQYTPQIAKTDATGRPVLKNLDKLNKLLQPKMYRVLKKDCLDLPEKIYQTIYYELTPTQQRIYDQVDEELRFECDGEIDIFSPLTKQTKLQQIAAGFILRDGDITNVLASLDEEDNTTAELVARENNPRMECLRTKLEDVECQFIIWARFKQEIAQIAELLREMGITFVEYHGGVKKAAREVAIDNFQSGVARAFLGNAQSGGIGLTLTKAEEMIYYSQNNQAEIRWQSEDRAHRIGTVTNVIYTDICAIGTIDEKITANLQAKEDMAATLLDSTENRFVQAARSQIKHEEPTKKQSKSDFQEIDSFLSDQLRATK